MEGRILNHAVFALLSLICMCTSCLANEVLDSNRLSVARCRASCFEDDFTKADSMDKCRSKPECFMCWETCDMFFTNYEVWGPMCSYSSVCFHGCQKACEAYQNITSGDTDPTTDFNSWIMEDKIKVLDLADVSKTYVEWSKPVQVPRTDVADKEKTFVYLIVQNYANKWEEIMQTTSRHASLSLGTLKRDTRLVVVSKDGVVAEEPILAQAAPKDKETEVPVEKRPWTVGTSWTLKLLSLQRDMHRQTEAVIAWEPLPGAVKYDVAWRVLDDTMDITGHLYSWTNITSLSLMFSSVYSVEVSGLNKEGDILDTSVTLIVNTKILDTATVEQSQQDKTGCHDSEKSLMLVLVCLSGVTLFVSVCGIALFVRISLKNKVKRDSETPAPSVCTEKALSPLPHKKLDMVRQLSHETVAPRLSLVRKLSRRLSNLEMQYSPMSPLRQCYQREGGLPAEDQKEFFIFPEDEIPQE